MVTVDIIHGVAVFEDTIKNKAILTRNLKVIKTHSEPWRVNVRVNAS